MQVLLLGKASNKDDTMTHFAIVAGIFATISALAGAAIAGPYSSNGFWPFSFAETLTLIGVATTSIIGIINALKTQKVHHLVNRNFSEQKEKIEDLSAALSLEKEVSRAAEKITANLSEQISAMARGTNPK